MKILPKISIQFFLTIFLLLFFVVEVHANGTCCDTNQCMETYCVNDNNCSSTCEGAGVGCEPPGTCYNTYSTDIQCDGVPYGPCIDGCQTRTCQKYYDVGEGFYLDVLNIQGCDNMVCGRQTDGTGSCHPASVPPPAPACDQTGLLHKYFTDSGTPYPIGNKYYCGLNLTLPSYVSCTPGWYKLTAEGYFNASETGWYAFRVPYMPILSLKIDVNGDGALDACGTNKFGDQYYLFGSDCCNNSCRPTTVGGAGTTCSSCECSSHCWTDDPNGLSCDKNTYVAAGSNVPYLAGANVGSTECPINGNAFDYFDTNGRIYVYFFRYLTAGPHKVLANYRYNYGSTANSTGHTLGLAYAKLSDSDISSGDTHRVVVSTPHIHPWLITWTETGSLSASECPFSPCVSAPPVVNVNSWWQVKDGDISANGSLRSEVPSATSLYFDIVGSGGFPGVPAYTGSTNLTKSNVSTKGWISNPSTLSAKSYGSSYFVGAVPKGIQINTISSTNSISSTLTTGGSADSNGYYWYVYDGNSTHLGDLSISSSINIGTRKVVLIVKNAGLNIKGNINLTKGRGFFMAVSSENIDVSSTVTSIEGIYVTDGYFNTGTGGSQTDSQLHVRGTVVGYNGITLERDLGDSANATTPAELFEYAPDQELLFPADFSKTITIWREIVP